MLSLFASGRQLKTHNRAGYSSLLVVFQTQKSSRLKSLKFIRKGYITILSGLLGLLVIPALYYSKIALALLLLVASGYLNTLDGTVARQTKTSSDFRSAMDIVTDRLVKISAVIGLWLVDPTHRAFLSLLMLASMLLCITSFLVVGIFTSNDSHKGFH